MEFFNIYTVSHIFMITSWLSGFFNISAVSHIFIITFWPNDFCKHLHCHSHFHNHFLTQRIFYSIFNVCTVCHIFIVTSGLGGLFLTFVFRRRLWPKKTQGPPHPGTGLQHRTHRLLSGSLWHRTTQHEKTPPTSHRPDWPTQAATPARWWQRLETASETEVWRELTRMQKLTIVRLWKWRTMGWRQSVLQESPWRWRRHHPLEGLS